MNEHFNLPKKILDKIKKDPTKLFIQIGSIDEIDQISKKKFYSTPYAFYKSFFSKYLLTLKFNKIIDVKIIYISSAFGLYQKKDRLIPNAINSFINNKTFKPSYPNNKRNFQLDF